MLTIPTDTTIIGELRSTGRMQIDGHIEGSGNVDGFVLISQYGVWKGNLTADHIVVEGTVEGNIIAREKLELSPSANVLGIIISPAIGISSGAKINGELRMRTDAPIGLQQHLHESIPTPDNVKELPTKTAAVS